MILSHELAGEIAIQMIRFGLLSFLFVFCVAPALVLLGIAGGMAVQWWRDRPRKEPRP